MITTTLAYIALASQDTTLKAGDFFPSKIGSKWYYEETIKQGKNPVTRASFTDTVIGNVDVNGKKGVYFETSNGANRKDPIVYEIKDDVITVIAFDPTKPLEDPYPILKLSKKRVEWNYAGQTVFLTEPVSMVMKGSAGLRGKRTFNGERVDTLEVKLKVTVDDRGAIITTDETMIYGKGIGLLEHRQNGKVGDTKTERIRKLIQYRPAN